MSIFQILKILPIMPFAWISGLLCRRKPVADRYFRLQRWCKFVIRYMNYTLSEKGVENIPLEGPVYFVCNHQGTLDPALVVATCPVPTAFISKKKNEKLPVFGSWAISIDVIHFDEATREGNIGMLREAARRLKQKRNLLVFPEGTRSKGDDMNEFKEGALQPAYMTKATIVPVTLNNAYCIDDKKDKNKQLGITYGKAYTHEMYKDYSHKEFSDILFKEIEKEIIKEK